jgi:hypothetical protein
MLVAGMALSQPAMAAQWSSAPKFCLPTSGVRWNTEAEREPCHCPPQSKCPQPLNLKPSDLMFYVSRELLSTADWATKWQDSFTISGSNVPALVNGSEKPEAVFAMNNDQLMTLLGLPKNWVDGSQIVSYDGTQSAAVLKNNIAVTSKSGGDDLISELLTMPFQLINQCCDNPCGANSGLTLQIKETSVAKPYADDFGLKLDQSTATKITADLVTLEGKLEALKNSADIVEATKSIGVALKAYVAKQGDNKLLDDLRDNTDDFEKLVDELPDGFRKDNKLILKDISELNISAANEFTKRTKPPKNITVDSIICAASLNTTVIREGCILSGTPITLTDGTTKPIEALKVGDQLQSHNGTATILAKSKFSQREDTMYSINKGEAFFTVEHPILTTQGWKSVDATVTSVTGDTIIVGSLAVGDVLLLAGGKELTVTSIDKKPLTNGVDAYNLSLTGDGSFVAQGFIMKGFKKMQMHY